MSLVTTKPIQNTYRYLMFGCDSNFSRFFEMPFNRNLAPMLETTIATPIANRNNESDRGNCKDINIINNLLYLYK